MRTVTAMDPALLPPTPAAPADRRTLREEIGVVLVLSLLASAVYAVIDLASAPVSGVYVAAGNQSAQFAKQVAGFVFGLAPVYLVFHLVRRDGEGLAGIGMAWDRPRSDVTRGLALFARRGRRRARDLLGRGRARREPVRRAGRRRWATGGPCPRCS